MPCSAVPCCHVERAHTAYTSNSAIGDHGQRHVGLGKAPAPGSKVDPFDAFRNRRANQYKDMVSISIADKYKFA